ncbi:MAG: SDR family oxidoreductase [Burkholderiales bacterium]|jgi:nucleoside-diphosphate-sugar epimerase|nr:SDR family oxidoreductase [Burkholderiales bacterium]
MKVLITGGGGFLGYRLAQAIAARGSLTGRDGTAQKVAGISLLDTAFPANVDARFKCITGDLSAPGVIDQALDRDTDAVFHLAAVVSGGAEADFDLGMRVNLDGTRMLLEACRKLAAPPRLVFASSVAAFGGDLPPVLDDSTTPNPQTSYGMQKVVGEYLVTDYTRKGFIDGRSLRLPTIVVRPGKPNLAASSFASGIIREPLNGEPSALPVPDTTGVWLLSPGKVIDAFIHAHELPNSAWGVNRVVNLPGITVTVREMLAALGRVAGAATAARVTYQPDERIQKIVKTWPAGFRTDRALALGFKADSDFEDVVREYVKDQGLRI